MERPLNATCHSKLVKWLLLLFLLFLVVGGGVLFSNSSKLRIRIRMDFSFFENMRWAYACESCQRQRCRWCRALTEQFGTWGLESNVWKKEKKLLSPDEAIVSNYDEISCTQDSVLILRILQTFRYEHTRRLSNFRILFRCACHLLSWREQTFISGG